jgi:signal transduction histidine kinase
MKLIITNMERLDQMVIGLLDASRLEAGESMLMEVTFCDLDKIIRQVIEELSLSFPNYFKVVSQGKCEGYWDESGLRRIVENLLTNAVKYGDENAPITISLSQNKKNAELSVHNLGKPISPEDVPILFEQYGRLKSSKLKTGWGLGLTMVKDMVDALNGSITLETDKGTIFKIKLPKDSRANIADRIPHRRRTA